MSRYYKKDETSSLLGKSVRVKIDRRKGTAHPDYPELMYNDNRKSKFENFDCKSLIC